MDLPARSLELLGRRVSVAVAAVASLSLASLSVVLAAASESWQSSDWAPAFVIGVLAEDVGFVLTFYLFLGFPSGRLQTLGNRLLVGAVAVATRAAVATRPLSARASSGCESQPG